MKEQEQTYILKKWLGLHRALVFKIVNAYTSDAFDQDDLFQEIIIQLWSSVPNFKNQSAESTWIYRIALNTAIKWVKKEQKHKVPEDPEKPEFVLTTTDTATDDRLDWLYEEIRKLDGIDRSLALLLLDGLNYKEMSEILGITVSNVGVKINRIKKHLISKSKKI